MGTRNALARGRAARVNLAVTESLRRGRGDLPTAVTDGRHVRLGGRAAPDRESSLTAVWSGNFWSLSSALARQGMQALPVPTPATLTSTRV